MQNKAFSEDFRLSSSYPCSFINEEREANLLLDTIKEALIERHIAIDYYHRQLPTFQSESDYATVDEETWNLGRALCRKTGKIFIVEVNKLSQ